MGVLPLPLGKYNLYKSSRLSPPSHTHTHNTMLKYAAVALLCACAAQASPIDVADAGEARLLFSTNSSLSSVVPDYRAVLAFIAIGLFIAAMVLRDGGDLGLPAGSAYDRYSQGYGQGYSGYAGQDFQARYGVSNLATKLTQLEKAFKKYEVETEECQMFVACEAAQYKKLAQNVPVVQIVSQILSAPGDDTKVSPKVLNAFRNGLAAHQNEAAEACEPLRQVCYAAHNQ